MELLYHQTNNLIQEVQERFIRLEKASIENVPMIENEIQARLDKITRYRIAFVCLIFLRRANINLF